MAIYRFRVAFEDYDVVREIDIKPNQTFEDLHLAIHKSINFDPNYSSSFYVSNDQWIKGQELAYLPSDRKQAEEITLMKNARMSKFIDDPHQKFYYISNFDRPFDFHVELSKIILDADESGPFPVCVRSSGEPPRQLRLMPQHVALEDVEKEEEESDIDESLVVHEFGFDSEDYAANPSRDTGGTETHEQEGEAQEGEEEHEDEYGELGYGTGTEDENY